MHTHRFLAAAGLAAFAVAAPTASVVVTSPVPTITAAPELVPRYESVACSFLASTNSNGNPISNCACGDFTTELAPTVISNTPVVICGGTTSKDPSPSEFSVQPLISAPAQVAFGDFHPTDLISAVSASCSNGCAATTTTLTTATTVNNPSGGLSAPTSLAIEYVVSTDIIPSDPDAFTSIMDGLSTMVMGASTNETFSYDGICPEPIGCNPPLLTQTNYYAPMQVQFSRFTMDSTGAYTDTAGVFELAITSKVVSTDNSALCSKIEAPIAAALGFVPGIGPAFGVIGSILCDLF